MEKLDFKKTLKNLYTAKSQPSLLDVPPMQFLMIDGAGNPNTSADYQDVVQALYSVSYTLKFKVKKEMGIDYGVMALEGLWWADDMSAFTQGQKDDWFWTLMIFQPDFITPGLLRAAIDESARKRDLPALPRLRMETYAEGPAAQLLHLGSYSEEGPNIQRLHEFIHAGGYALRGKHHEIYLSDPRRGDPAKVKTIIRQPVAKP